MQATIKDAENLPLVLTVSQVQEILGVSKAVAYQLAHRRGFPSFKLGRSIRVSKEALLCWLEQQAAGRQLQKT